MSPTASWLLVDKFIDDCGAPSDPIERFLLEHFFVSHIRCLYMASTPKHQDEPKHLAGYARLLSELRQLALAIKQYRSPVPSAAETTRQYNGAADAQHAAAHAGELTPARVGLSFAVQRTADARDQDHQGSLKDEPGGVPPTPLGPAGGGGEKL